MIGALVLYVIIFPFTDNPASINWNKEMRLTTSQKLTKSVTEYLKNQPVNHQAGFFSDRALVVLGQLP